MIVASVMNLLFSIPLLTGSPQFSVNKPSEFMPKKQSVSYQQATATVTGTQAITVDVATTATQTISVASQVQTQPDIAAFYHRVAARSLGEGSSAVAEIACTIKNRLRVSRAPLTVVLRAYHARDKTPKPEHIEMVRKVFEGKLPCPETWWYALSRADTRHFRPHPRPAAVINRNSSEVWIYDH
ncbi:hypothetical protein BH10CHL1_BH10CHL1_31340 [soil metagenome]